MIGIALCRGPFVPGDRPSPPLRRRPSSGGEVASYEPCIVLPALGIRDGGPEGFTSPATHGPDSLAWRATPQSGRTR